MNNNSNKKERGTALLDALIGIFLAAAVLLVILGAFSSLTGSFGKLKSRIFDHIKSNNEKAEDHKIFYKNQ